MNAAEWRVWSAGRENLMVMRSTWSITDLLDANLALSIEAEVGRRMAEDDSP